MLTTFRKLLATKPHSDFAQVVGVIVAASAMDTLVRHPGVSLNAMPEELTDEKGALTGNADLNFRDILRRNKLDDSHKGTRKEYRELWDRAEKLLNKVALKQNSN